MKIFLDKKERCQWSFLISYPRQVGAPRYNILYDTNYNKTWYFFSKKKKKKICCFFNLILNNMLFFFSFSFFFLISKYNQNAKWLKIHIEIIQLYMKSVSQRESLKVASEWNKNKNYYFAIFDSIHIKYLSDTIVVTNLKYSYF